MVRRYHGAAEDLRHRFGLRCYGHSARAQFARGDPRHREPVAGHLPSGRVPGPEDGDILLLREVSASADRRAVPVARPPRLRRGTRPGKGAKADAGTLELTTVGVADGRSGAAGDKSRPPLRAT